MTRPTRITVNAGDNSWEAQLNTNLQQLYDRPLPIFVHAGDLTSLEAARPAAQFDQCIAWVDYDGGTTPGKHMAFSNGTVWKLTSDWEVNRRTFRSTGSTGAIADADDVVISTGGSNILLTLPAITDANEGRVVRIKRQGAGTCTMDTTGADTIDGAATFLLENVDDSFEFVSDGTSEWLVFSGSGSGGAADFVGLTDTPGSYAGGDALKVVRVNAAEDALEFAALPIIPDEFTDLVDTPNAYAGGDALKVVRVNAGETALEFATPSAGVTDFVALDDTPANFAGAGLLLVRVNTGEDALEFVAPPGGIAGNTIFAIAAGNETDVITTGLAKVTFRMPGTFSLDAVRCSLTTASATGTVTIDINKNGTSILSTKLTIDATEDTSKTAAVAHVQTADPISIADDDVITIDIDDAGSSADAAGLKIYFEGQANAADFLDLGDSPSTYASGDALKYVRVNAAEDAVEFTGLGIFKSSADANVAKVTATHATLTAAILEMFATRAASSAYKFLTCDADSVEMFSVRGDGLVTAKEGFKCTPGGSILGLDIAGGSGNTNVLIVTDHANATYAGTVELLRVDRTGNSAFNFLSTQSDLATAGNNRHILRGDGAFFSDIAAATPADYAEMFECVNPTGYPMGRAVQLSDSVNNAAKVELASDVDEIIGFTSANPGIIADMAWNGWKDRWLKTEFGAYLRNESGDQITNPAHDPDRPYVSREDREEWMAIGMLGKIWVEGDRANILPGSRVTLLSDGVMRPLTAQERTDKMRSWRVMEVGTWNPTGSYLPIRILFN